MSIHSEHAKNNNKHSKNNDIFLFASANALPLNRNSYQKWHEASTVDDNVRGRGRKGNEYIFHEWERVD